MTEIFVSVIIPTYSRKESLLCTLESLSRQTYPANCFEVIVVDDGSNDGTEEVTIFPWPFSLRYLWQENQGGVRARNRGAEAAKGELLVFLDDDMTPEPGYIEGLACRFAGERHLLARGRLAPWADCTSVFARHCAVRPEQSSVPTGDFSSNNLAIRSDDFWALGDWQDLLPGVKEHRGGIWSDLEFAVRASQHAYRLITVENARIVHRDYAIRTLESACRRAYMVSKSAVQVLRKHPSLLQHMPMLHDKGPIAWRNDRLTLIARKLARQAASSPPALRGMECLVRVLEARSPSPAILERLYRWIGSAYIYRGYRAGLQESQQEETG
jgi:glycosyltransferase involved in cell wall biosynthesis